MRPLGRQASSDLHAWTDSGRRTEKIKDKVVCRCLGFVFEQEEEYESGFRYMSPIQEEMSDRQLLHID